MVENQNVFLYNLTFTLGTITTGSATGSDFEQIDKISVRGREEVE